MVFFLIRKGAVENFLTRKEIFHVRKINYLRLIAATGIEQRMQVTYLGTQKKFESVSFVHCPCVRAACGRTAVAGAMGKQYVIVGVSTSLWFCCGRQLHDWILQFLYQQGPEYSLWPILPALELLHDSRLPNQDSMVNKIKCKYPEVNRVYGNI